jgi:hypothetical protein
MTKKRAAATKTKKKASPLAPPKAAPPGERNAKAPPPVEPRSAKVPASGQESGLAAFLKARRQQQQRSETVHNRLARWKAAVHDLVTHFQAVLAPAGDQAELTTWNVLLKEENVRYNATALTVDFGDQNIVVEPRGLNAEGVGVVTAMSGARAFRFLWSEANGWRFEWLNPERHAPAEPVTSAALELVIEALLA